MVVQPGTGTSTVVDLLFVLTSPPEVQVVYKYTSRVANVHTVLVPGTNYYTIIFPSAPHRAMQ